MRGVLCSESDGASCVSVDELDVPRSFVASLCSSASCYVEASCDIEMCHDFFSLADVESECGNVTSQSMWFCSSQ